MKKANIIFSIALIALTAAAWTQEHAMNERLISENQVDVQVLTADYRLDRNGVGTFIHRLQDWLMPVEERGVYESPEVSMSFFFENTEVVYDKGSTVEKWMAVPFEEQLDEELVSIEKWMTLPFKNKGAGSGHAVDAWASVPIEGCLIEEVVLLEAWMAAPFENELAEEPLSLENWMADPFEEQLTEEPLGLEDWMTRPFEMTSRCDEGSLMANSPD